MVVNFGHMWSLAAVGFGIVQSTPAYLLSLVLATPNGEQAALLLEHLIQTIVPAACRAVALVPVSYNLRVTWEIDHYLLYFQSLVMPNEELAALLWEHLTQTIDPAACRTVALVPVSYNLRVTWGIDHHLQSFRSSLGTPNHKPAVLPLQYVIQTLLLSCWTILMMIMGWRCNLKTSWKTSI